MPDNDNTPSTNLETIEDSINLDQPPEAVRRDFLKRFGGLAAATPVVTFTLMSSYSSKAIASGGSESTTWPD